MKAKRGQKKEKKIRLKYGELRRKVYGIMK